MKRTAIRRKAKRAMSAAERRAAGEFFAAVVKGRVCVVCGDDEVMARKRGTKLQAHHVLSQQQLRAHGLEHLLWAQDNGVPACEEPCHRRHTSAVRRIPRAALPRAAIEFAAENDLMYLIERYYP